MGVASVHRLPCEALRRAMKSNHTDDDSSLAKSARGVSLNHLFERLADESRGLFGRFNLKQASRDCQTPRP